jgi:hypothetical protein
MSNRNDGEWDWTNPDKPLQPKSWFGRKALVVGIVLGLIPACILGFYVYAGFLSLDAENNMQSARFIVQLVEQFVKDNQRWPKSWEELEAMKMPRDDKSEQSDRWPDRAEEVKKRVHINFQPDLNEIIHQDRYTFDAIKPIGRHYEYRGYGDVDNLQEALRGRVSGLNK